MTNAVAKSTAQYGARARAEALKAAAVAFVLGSSLVWLTGFAAPAQIHDAAHDTRHALSFPCH